MDIRKLKPYLVGLLLLVLSVRLANHHMLDRPKSNFSDTRSANGDVVVGSLRFSPCELGKNGERPLTEAVCTSITVPENYDRQAGRTIKLFVAMFPSRSLKPSHNPVFFLPGGPGQAASESFLALGDALPRLNEDRDIVLLDARGTGQSEPAQCPSAPQIAKGLTSGDVEVTASATALCRITLGQNSDLTRYGTEDVARDLWELQTQLKVEKSSLVAVSYGTRIAQRFVQEYPSNVEAVVLDSVLPEKAILGSEAEEILKAALDDRLHLCDSDSRCAASSSQASSYINRLFDRDHPVDLGTEAHTLGEMLAFRQLAMRAETAELIPVAAQASSSGDHTIIRASLKEEAHMLEGISWLSYLSTTCNESADAIGSEPDASRSWGIRRMLLAQCKGWPRSAARRDGATINDGTSSVPTLILAGQMDPLTPASYAHQVQEHLKQSHLVVLPLQAHNVIGRACAPSLATTFLNNPTTDSFDTSCVGSYAPPVALLGDN
ncbi:alpha/beta hydrolase [Xanthomonas hyacinthi]|uniref:Proline iminopeptidase n=1 Tax=Xanthomonas hyacinthi TaxID=56455 RepID=A0A2S7F1J1_9XANT|nr:alpha/beta hydrolase [Xanthomonas hyacinthi]KLD78878.1 hypothetical protein Y886_07715 [Xanthomonas hyacinthi DSM 19077]PPU99301.1 hypothetical protein XhyaCFBP1156_03255 [Xanthomonas hyacinthi]QGY78289.1 alpha/beta hydrolase [Xanthomonas hyacinthi]